MYLCKILDGIFYGMTQQDIKSILKMRMAVYRAGIKAGCWIDLNSSGASDMMAYIFPKTGMIAYYNLILELMRKEHSMFLGGVYSLFKMPVQVEKELVEYIKTDNSCVELIDDDNCDDYLESMDTVITDHCLSDVNIGTFNVNNVGVLLRLCASHYRYAFQNNVKSFPFFE